MSIRRIVLIAATACLLPLAACSSSSKLSDVWASKSNGTPNVAATGSVPRPAGSAANAGVRVGASDDDLRRGKKYFAGQNYELAAASFRSATDKHPDNAKAWIGLARSYDYLHRFDLADQAYDQAIRLAGATAEILNDQGYSYMLRGDYDRAQKTLEDAEAKDPADPYVQANMQLLEQSYFRRKAAQ